jgi:hypothetical protein
MASDAQTVTDAPTPDRRLAFGALAVGLLALVLAVALQPSIVTGGADSLQATAIAVGLGVLFLVFVVAVFRLVHRPVLLAALVGIPPLALAAVLGVTSLVDDEADDADAEQLADQLAEAEARPPSTDPADAEVATPTTAVPAGPVRLSTGTFQGLDDHAAAGTVSLVE